jgi:hypothetical protein
MKALSHVLLINLHYSLTMTPEGKVQDECLRGLTKAGWYAFITKNMGTYDESSGVYRRNSSVFAIRGIADAIAIRDGQVLFIEFKTKTGVQSDHQKKFERAITRHGGKYLLVRSIGDLHEYLDQHSTREH